MPRNRQPLAPGEAELWGDMLAAAQLRREAEARAARPPGYRRLWRAAWHRKVMAVPVVVIAGLLGTAVAIRANAVDPVAVGLPGVLALCGWWHWRARRAASPALSMTRPTLAVLYLVLASVLG